MPVSFRVLPEHFLVYIDVDGWLGISEGVRATDAFVADPGYAKGMRQLVDLRDLTGWERDFAEIMKNQARQVDVHDDPRRPAVIVVLAPGAEARGLAGVIQLPWTNTQRVVSVTVETEAEALAVLGLQAASLARLLEGT